MHRIFARYADRMDAISVFIGQACSVLFFVCILISGFEVVMRYGFDRPTLWSTELAMTLCATVWVLSVGYVTQRHRHISITMVELLVSAKAWRTLRLVQLLVSFGAVAVLTVALWGPAVKAVTRMEHSGTALNSLQPAILKAILVIGCLFYLAQLAANIIRWVQGTEGDISGGH